MQVIVAERGDLLFVFNFSPFDTYEGFKVRSCGVISSSTSPACVQSANLKLHANPALTRRLKDLD